MVICKDNEDNCYKVIKKYSTVLFKYMRTPTVSLLMLLSVLVKNNFKFLSNISRINEFMVNLFCPEFITYCRNNKNLSIIYFLLLILENIVFYKNKIIFKNQMLISSYMNQLSDLNENIQRFLDDPKFIDWEYHEIDF